jgi:hypothetical protein
LSSEEKSWIAAGAPCVYGVIFFQVVSDSRVCGYEHKIQPHIKTEDKVHEILPIAKIVLLHSKFRKSNPGISGAECQLGDQMASGMQGSMSYFETDMCAVAEMAARIIYWLFII